MKPDHEAAKKWAHDVWGTLKDIALHEVLETDAIDHRNVAACYLDAMAQRDKATELLRELVDGLVPCNEPVEPGSVVARVDAFLERKTDDKQS